MGEGKNVVPDIFWLNDLFFTFSGGTCVLVQYMCGTCVVHVCTCNYFS